MDLYFKLIQHLATYGQVLTEHLGDKNLTSVGEDITDELIYNRDMAWVKEADVIIAEVSTPSLGIGYEIGKAENIDKKILCLYREQADKRLSAMISGNSNIKVVRYNTLEEAINNVDDYFKLL